MCTSELSNFLDDNPSVGLLNIFINPTIKRGYKIKNLKFVYKFLYLLKAAAKDEEYNVFEQVEMFLKKFTPRVSIVEITKQGKKIKIPSPTGSMADRRKIFITTHIQRILAKSPYKLLPKQLYELFITVGSQQGPLFKEWEESFSIFTKNRSFVKGLYEAKLTSKYAKKKNVIKKGVKFYL